MSRGERLIKLRNSWFSMKFIKVKYMILFFFKGRVSIIYMKTVNFKK
jgi:hypothetical protein